MSALGRALKKNIFFDADIVVKNRMWLSIVCTLIKSDMRHQSGLNVVDSRGAAE